MSGEMAVGSRPATAADVAARAGVSRTTVSHILNGRAQRFPAATRQRVLDAASELDYRPSPAGRSLVNGRSDTVVVVAPNTTWGPNLQDAVEQVAHDVEPLGGTAFVRFVGAEEGASTVSSILTLRPLAVVDLGVLTDADRRRLEDHGVITAPNPQPGGVGVGLDRTIAELQLHELLRHSDRTIAFGALADTRLDQYGPGRFRHLQDLCREQGRLDPLWVDVPMDPVRATAVVAELLQRGPVGVACYNDDVAIALVSSAARLGAAVPDALSAVGVDHTAVGQLWTPPLTSIAVDVRAIMDAAIHDIRVALDGESRSPILPQPVVRLVPGGTT